MKKIFILLLSFSFSGFYGFSQIVEHPGTGSRSQDVARVDAFIKKTLPFALYKKTLDSAEIYLQKIYALSQYRNYNRGLAQYYRLKAVVSFTKGQPDSVFPNINREFYFARKSGLPREIALANDLKAWVFQNREEYDSAAHYFIKALYIADSLKDNKFSGEINTNLSVLFWGIKDYHKAATYATKGYYAGKALNDSLIIINSLFNLGNAEAGLKKYDTALYLFDQVKNALHDPVKYNYTLVRAMANEAGIYADLDKNNEAIRKYNDVLKYRKQIPASILSFLYNGLGLAQYKENKFREAEANMHTAIKIAEEANERISLRDSYQYMAEIKEEENQFASALFYRKKYDSLKDTLLSESAKRNMHLLDVKYQTAQKDKQIAQQNLVLTKNQRSLERKNTWLFIFVSGLIALAVIFMLSLRSYHHKRKLHQQSLLTLQKQHEVDTLKTKMDAREEERNRIGKEMHDDIGSALTTILYLSNDLKRQSNGNSKSTSDRIAETASTVVDKMNEIIWSMHQEYDTLDDLIAYTRQHAAGFLKNYDIHYCFKAPEPVPDVHLQGEQRRNIYLVIKESLHNIVKHAHATDVKINFFLNEKLTVTIQDNGKGIDPEKLRRFGNGLRNMRQRMEAVGGNFEIYTDNGTCIKLECPLS